MTTKRPIAQLRDGLLQLAIWQRDTDKGCFYSVTVERRYKKDGTWAGTQSLGEDDLLKVGELLRQAYQEILNRKRPATDATTGEG